MAAYSGVISNKSAKDNQPNNTNFFTATTGVHLLKKGPFVCTSSTLGPTYNN